VLEGGYDARGLEGGSLGFVEGSRWRGGSWLVFSREAHQRTNFQRTQNEQHTNLEVQDHQVDTHKQHVPDGVPVVAAQVHCCLLIGRVGRATAPRRSKLSRAYSWRRSGDCSASITAPYL